MDMKLYFWKYIGTKYYEKQCLDIIEAPTAEEAIKHFEQKHNLKFNPIYCFSSGPPCQPGQFMLWNGAISDKPWNNE